MSELETGFRLGDVVAIVRRRILVVVAAALVGAIAGYLVLAAAPTVFSATARVQVRPLATDPAAGSSGLDSDLVDMPTETDLVKSDDVISAAREDLGLSGDNRAVRQRVTVLTEEKSLILQITFEGDTAADARDGANDVAEAYRQNRRADAEADRQRFLAQYQQELSAATGAQQEASAALDLETEGTPAYREASSQLDNARDRVAEINTSISTLGPEVEVDAVARLVTEAPTPSPVTSKMAIGKGVGVFGLFVLAGLGLVWYLDRRDGLSGGRRRVEALLPDATMRVLPGADGRAASAAVIDTAIDRLAVDLVSGGAPGKPRSVLVIGAGSEPPTALAEELASSLAFAGIPTLFVLAGSSDRELRQARVVTSFADLLTAGSLIGPAGLPESAGADGGAPTPTVTWLRPRGSAEASGLLRRAVIDTLVTRAARERFEAVVFVAPSPARAAAGTALGQWVDRTTLVVAEDERTDAEPAALALTEADVRVTEVVWT